MTTKEKITLGIAYQNLNALIDNFKDSQDFDTNAIKVVGMAVSNAVGFRDVLLGLPLTLTEVESVQFIEALIPLVQEKERHAFYTVLSALHFTAGDKALADLALTEAKALSANYPLALLLTRVFGAGWSHESFKAMRDELHPKVVQTLEDDKDEVISILN